MGEDHASVMERYREAWLRNDWETALSLWSDDIVHHVPGRHRLAGTFAGKRAFLDHYNVLFEEMNGTIEVVEFHDLLVSDEHAVALVRERAIRGEQSLDFNRVVVYHFGDGLITETWSHDFDPYSLDEFWS